MSAYTPPRCPADAAHGVLLDWPTRTAAFYCPARRHEGMTAFYTTDLLPARPARDVPPPGVARGPRRQEGDGGHYREAI